MFSIKGFCTIVKTNTVTNEVEVFEEHNLIPNELFQSRPSIGVEASAGENVQAFRNCSIIISTDQRTPTKARNTIDGVIGVGFVDSGVTSPIYQSASLPRYMQIQGRIGFIGTTRTIYTVGLTNLLSATLGAQRNSYVPSRNLIPVEAYLKLSSPCVQGPTDILDIFYRIIIDVSNYTGQYNLTKRATENITDQMVSARNTFTNNSSSVYLGNTAFSHLATTPCSIPDQTSYPYIEFATTDNTYNLPRYSGFIGNCGYAQETSIFSSIVALPSIISVPCLTGTNIIPRYSLYKKIITFNVSANTTLTGDEISVDTVGGNGSIHGRHSTIFNGMLYGKCNSTVPFGQYTDTQPNLSAAYWAENIKFATSIFQSVYTHSTDAFYPFQDVNRLGFGSGIYTLTETPSWTSLIPQMFYMNIDVTGAVGVATYRYSIAPFLGVDGNTWVINRPALCPYNIVSRPYVWTTRGAVVTADTPIPFLKCHGNNSSRATKFSNTQIIQWDDNGLTLLDVMTGVYKNWDSTTTNALAVTALKQVEVNISTGIIYAACRNTGLYSINASTGVVTTLSTDPCTGVDVGRSGLVFATFSGSNARLSTSTNFATALSFTATDITTGTGSSWSNICYLKADPDPIQTNNRIGIVSNNSTTNTGRITWYQLSDGATSSCSLTLNSTHRSFSPDFSNSFDVGNLLSLWSLQFAALGTCSIEILTWGQTTAITQGGGTQGTTYGRPPGDSIQFTEQGFLIGDAWVCNGSTGNSSDGGGTTNIISPIAAMVHNYSGYTRRLGTILGNSTATISSTYIGSDRFVYLSKGFAHFGSYNVVIFPYFIYSSPGPISGATIKNPLVWDDYEWNGSSWVIRAWSFAAGTWTQASSIGSKTTHSNAQTLIQGLSIAFANGGSIPSYNATDYYTQVICRGIHHDMSNTLAGSWNLFTKPYIKSQAFSGTVPASAPFQLMMPKSIFGSAPDAAFVALDNQQADLSFTVNIAGYGSSVVTYYENSLINTTPIGPNEVAIDQKGLILFSSTDAGKAVSGTYSYVQGAEPYAAINTLYGIKGLVMGFDNTSINDTAGVVTSWSDITPNGFDATPIAPGNAPTRLVAALNGLDVVSFNDASSNRFLKIVSSNTVSNGKLVEDLSRGYSMVAVINMNGIGNSGSVLKAFLALCTSALINDQDYDTDSTLYIRGLSFGLANDNTVTAAYDTTLKRMDSTRFSRLGTGFSSSLWSTIIFTVMPDNNAQIRVNQAITEFAIEDIGIFNKLQMEVRNQCYINYHPLNNTPTYDSSRCTRASIAAQYFFNVGLNSYECRHIEAQLKSKYALTGY